MARSENGTKNIVASSYCTFGVNLTPLVQDLQLVYVTDDRNLIGHISGSQQQGSDCNHHPKTALTHSR